MNTVDLKQERIGIGQYPHYRSSLDPNTVVTATVATYEEYGQGVQARIQASLESIYASLNQMLIDFEPRGEIDKNSAVIEVPRDTWERFYQGHKRVENALFLIAHELEQEG